MMTYQTHAIAKYRIQEARDRAAARRLARAASSVGIADRGVIAVFDAVGHGLIAVGSRLVSDPSDHPTHHRAA